jgi:hypothetical protein
MEKNMKKNEFMTNGSGILLIGENYEYQPDISMESKLKKHEPHSFMLRQYGCHYFQNHL